ncbi:hypothetical protein ZOSMA_38G00750 [Zostera marina]|uniref:Uncharacterized protein n=1 Tax=Zostera marina TaxID=29655 RepID=A0A0K9P4I8_ZOSMR|nr:hypothetical protein ZOSMA_38G00750 [Zostera marina]
MWRSTSLRLLVLQSNGRTTSNFAGSLSFHSRFLSSDSDDKTVKKEIVENAMPNLTGFERDEIEGNQNLDVDAPCGSFGTKEVSPAIQSFSDKRIAGCPLILFLMAMVPPKEEGSTHFAFWWWVD